MSYIKYVKNDLQVTFWWTYITSECFVSDFNTHFFIGLMHLIENHLLQNTIFTLLLNILKAKLEVEEYIKNIVAPFRNLYIKNTM